MSLSFATQWLSSESMQSRLATQAAAKLRSFAGTDGPRPRPPRSFILDDVSEAIAKVHWPATTDCNLLHPATWQTHVVYLQTIHLSTLAVSQQQSYSTSREGQLPDRLTCGLAAQAIQLTWRSVKQLLNHDDQCVVDLALGLIPNRVIHNIVMACKDLPLSIFAVPYTRSGVQHCYTLLVALRICWPVSPSYRELAPL
jgi:hypothetical protein